MFELSMVLIGFAIGFAVCYLCVEREIKINTIAPPHPCPKCEGPSMCQYVTMTYDCFNCGHKWKKDDKNQLKAKVKS